MLSSSKNTARTDQSSTRNASERAARFVPMRRNLDLNPSPIGQEENMQVAAIVTGGAMLRGPPLTHRTTRHCFTISVGPGVALPKTDEVSSREKK
jgi:hypothetical protein